jgi:peptidoglycan-associated lipoprotein
MKMTKLIYPLAFVLATALAATGCKHEPGKVTQLPGENPPAIAGDNGAGTLPGETLPPDTNAIAQPGGGPTANISPEDYTQDRDALAADTIHFAYDSTAIRDIEQANLQSVASALAADANAKLLIEGNCDERGTEEYNRSLGERRALAAREALAKLGVDPMRVRTISYGKDKPADSGHDEAAWKQNRRDDFVLLHPKTGA